MLWAGLAGSDSLDNRRSSVGEVLVGRSGELAPAATLVQQARTGGCALLFLGEPGTSKIALLDAASDAAAEAGALVLRAAGVEFEADLAFSGLHQALLPLLDVFPKLGITSPAALRDARGFPSPARPAAVSGRVTLTNASDAYASKPPVS